MRARLPFPETARPERITPWRRISIVGPAGSGKTTLSKACTNLGLRHIKVDKELIGPTGRLSPEHFRARMAAVAQGESWIIDGNVLIADVYAAVPEVWERADTIVWLDIPRWVIIPRLIIRTGRRAYRRMSLPDGARQSWHDLFDLDPARSVIGWTWFEQPDLREAYEKMTRDPRWSDRVVRLRTPRDVRAFTRTLEHHARQRSHRNDDEALT
jgi:adenylate kinase family enzyme